MGCHPRKAVELPGHHTEIFLRQFCLSCCLAFSCVVTFRRGKCREGEWGEGARVKRQQRAMLGCVASHPSKWQERKREGAGESWQFPSDELRKHTKPKTFAKNVKRNACPSIRVSAFPSVRRLQLQLSFSIRACPSAHSSHSSQLSVRPPLCVCLSVCLFGSSFRLPVSVSVSVAVSASVSSSLLSPHLLLSLVYNKSAAPRLYLCPGLAWPVRPCGTLSAASNTSMFILQVKRK